MLSIDTDTATSTEILSSIYYYMQLTRELDTQAYHLYSQGYLCTYPSSKGQEALFVAAAHALSKDDIYIPYYRDQGALLTRGVAIDDMIAYWAGHNINISNPNTQDHPYCVPIATQTTHAVGAAYALAYHNKNAVVVCSIGDGATSKGDFYEAINFACVHKLPIIFNINVNQWAISTPLHQQTCDLSKKLSGFSCIQKKIDASNPLNVYHNMQQVRKDVIKLKTPAYILNHTQRLCAHTATDDFGKYHDINKLQQLIQNHDPVKMYQQKLEQEIDIAILKQQTQQAKEAVAQAIVKFKTKLQQQQYTAAGDIYAK